MNKANGGYVSLADFLSPAEAEAMGAHSNQQPVLYLNAVQQEKSLAQVATAAPVRLGHDPQDRRWLYEFMAQAASVLTGHETANPNDYQLESMGRPFVTPTIAASTIPTSIIRARG
ncbi:MAG: hypothetical protein AB7S38_12745 [Vulcanimicrobiota bacterium]